MRKQLYIMRHAKSDWSRSLPDEQRPLNKRGVQAVKRMGRWMQSAGLRPTRIYSSNARRAEQTVRGIVDYLEYDESQIHWDKRLYLASLDTLLSLAGEWLPQSDSLMLVGHNPGLEELVRHLVPESRLNDYGKLFPTAAVAVMEVPPDLAAGSADLIHLRRPRDLED